MTEYDQNGNIKKLQRYGQTGASSYGLVDNLTYTYNGNQLTKVEDAVTATSYTRGTNFVNGSTATTEYTYDNNGNLTKDLNKGISSIQYNSLSLPSQVLFDNGATQTYHYTADGEKWRTVYTAGLLLKDTVDYCGGAIIENGVLKKLLTPVGYVDMSGSTPSYYYYLKDHQGNNRVVVNSSGSVVETNHYYTFGGLFSTSTNVQPYKYNGKELDTKKGLNWYDYGARHYDAVLGRWHVVDPMAEKYYPYSLYVYCGNNPVRYVDPTGEGWNDALPHLNKIFSVNVSLGMRLGVEVDTPSAKIGVDVNAGSISVGSDGYKLTKGASVGVGIAEIAINTEVFEISDEISAREKNYSANILGFGVDHSKTEIFDASKEYFEKIKEVSDTETSFTTSIGAAFGIGVDVEIDMVEVKNFFIKLFE